jgi:WD40 repeat protein
LGKFAPSAGRLAVIADPVGLHVVDCTTGKEQHLILKQTAISAMIFSPKDSFLVTCEKFVQGEKNLIVWDISSGLEVA